MSCLAIFSLVIVDHLSVFPTAQSELKSGEDYRSIILLSEVVVRPGATAELSATTPADNLK